MIKTMIEYIQCYATDLLAISFAIGIVIAIWNNRVRHYP